MPGLSGQEHSDYNNPHDWKVIESMILENLSFPLEEELQKLREEVRLMLEELKNVCEVDRRDND
jgi:hypothetical protein